MGVRQVKAAETRQALKQAARQEFAERGFLNTKITDLTATAGRATGSFYDHFADKDELLREMLADMQDQGHHAIRESDEGARHPREHNLAERAQLKAHIGAGWQVINDNWPVVAALFESSISAGPGSGEAWQRLAADTEIFRDHLDYMKAQGQSLPGDPVLIAATIGAALSMLAYALHGAKGVDYAAEEVVDTLTALLLDGLRGPAS